MAVGAVSEVVVKKVIVAQFEAAGKVIGKATVRHDVGGVFEADFDVDASLVSGVLGGFLEYRFRRFSDGYTVAGCFLKLIALIVGLTGCF